ncbi:hypothetical protein VTK73DRAFT_3261 [Phialemonium thermophilum]|uniref:Uncharacterized protein n=1 Tax=Phialemonium thermophilum TaxID=223376 RepID=A0ABR3Y928_9PEZI
MPLVVWRWSESLRLSSTSFSPQPRLGVYSLNRNTVRRSDWTLRVKRDDQAACCIGKRNRQSDKGKGRDSAISVE